MPETPYDGIDQDCSGADLKDSDGDGYVGIGAGGNDCDDTDPTIHPGAPEDPDRAVDRDCDGWTSPTSGLSPVGCSSQSHLASLAALAMAMLSIRRRQPGRGCDPGRCVRD
jgi:hypothetical protein